LSSTNTNIAKGLLQPTKMNFLALVLARRRSRINHYVDRRRDLELQNQISPPRETIRKFATEVLRN
jgi:hypothetical protein